MADTEKQIIILDGTRPKTLYTKVEEGKLEDGTPYEKRQAVSPRGFTTEIADSKGNNLDVRLDEMQEQLDGVSTDISATIETAITERTEDDIATKEEVEALKNGVVDADTVDGYHAEDLAKRFAFVDFVDQDYTFAAMQSSVPAENKLYRLQLEANGQAQLWESLDNGATWAVKKVLSADYLPLTGGTLSGDLFIKNKYARLQADSNHAGLTVFNKPNNITNARQLRLLNSVFASDLKNALQIIDYVNGVTTGYNVLHTGNSKPVAVDTSAPTDTTAVWIDKANKVVKAYIDGAWTAVS